MPDGHKAILIAANAAISAGDHEGFLAFCDENIEWSTVGGETLHGKDAVRSWMKTEYIRPPEFNVHELIADGDLLAALGEIVVQDEAGQRALHAYCDVWRFKDGKMVELRAFVIKK
ncbi:nuclear transport factor 2 family protein [Pseudoduganella rhizocola]|uniref:nuclear transport factor 2 family protein n=1 Tax=Pseudoduganella rhizocola TaxID=3382643 RepID=UPI0038B50E3B